MLGCDPKLCDPPPIGWPNKDPFANYGGPSPLAAVPLKCKQAIFEGGAFEAACASQSSFSLIELLAIAGKLSAQDVCTGATGFKCSGGAYCVAGPSLNNCIVCNTDGQCFHEVQTGGGQVKQCPAGADCTYVNDDQPSIIVVTPPPPIDSPAKEPKDINAPPVDKPVKEPPKSPPAPTQKLANSRLKRKSGGVPNRPAVPPTTKADPVAVGSRELYLEETDLEIAPPPGSDLGFRMHRSYTSTGVFQGALGRSWLHDYEEALVPIDEHAPDLDQIPVYCTEALPTIRCVAHETAPGLRALYVLDQASLFFLPRFGGYSTVFHNRSGWVMRERNGIVTHFDSRGRLQRKVDRNGRTMHFYYGNRGTGPLAMVVDPLERAVVFEYGSDGLLQLVRDFAGRTVRYEYERLAIQAKTDALPGQWADAARLRRILVSQTPTSTPEVRRRYEYLALSEINVALGKVPRLGGGPGRRNDPYCGKEGDDLAAKVNYDNRRDRLLGDLRQIFDGKNELLVDTNYQLDATATDFDQVTTQRSGRAAFDATIPAATFATLRSDALASDPTAVPLAAKINLEQTTNTSGYWVKARLPKATADCDALHLKWPYTAEDHSLICSWTRYTNQAGEVTITGANVLGAPLVEYQNGHRWVWSRNAFGEITREAPPSGDAARRRELIYSENAKSIYARGNLIEVHEGPTAIERVWRYRYEPIAQRLRHLTTPDGHITRWEHDARGNVLPFIPPDVTLPTGSKQKYQVDFHYTPFGQLDRMADSEGAVTELIYHPGRAPSGTDVITPQVHEAILALSPSQQAARATTGGYLAERIETVRQDASATALARPAEVKRRTSYHYDGVGLLDRITNPQGGVTRFVTSWRGDLEQRIDQEGVIIALDYDREHRVVRQSTKGSSPRVTRSLYDRAGNRIAICIETAAADCDGSLLDLVAKRAANGKLLLTTFAYDGESRLTDIIDGDGYKQKLTYDTAGRLGRRTFGLGSAAMQFVDFGYDVDGLLTSVNQGGLATTRYDYDAFWQLATITAPNQTVRTLLPTPSGDVKSDTITDKNGVVLRRVVHAYDERGRLWKSTADWLTPSTALPPVGYTKTLITVFERDGRGAVVRRRDPDAKSTLFAYDTLGRPIYSRTPTGDESFVYRQDDKGQVLTKQRGVETTARLDKRGDVTDIASQSMGKVQKLHFDYNELGAIRHAVDAVGNERFWRYDSAGRLMRQEEPKTTRGPPELVTRYDYDRRENPIAKVDPTGVTTALRVNAAGHVDRYQQGNLGEQAFYYDLAGRLTRHERGTVVVENTYRDGLLERRTAGDREQRFVRDGLGRVRVGFERQGTLWSVVSRQYDSLDRVVEETTSVRASSTNAADPPSPCVFGGASCDFLRPRQVLWAFDRAGNARQVQYPTGTIAARDFDADGRMTFATWLGFTASFGWLGEQLTTQQVQSIYDWQAVPAAFEQPSSLTAIAKGQTFFAEQRTPDDQGRIDSQTVKGPWGTRVWKADYAGTGWLTALTNSTTGAVTSFARDNNGALLDAGPWLGYQRAGLSYSQGRVIADGAQTYAYNAFDQHESVAKPNGEVVKYLYDVYDRRIARLSGPNGARKEAQVYEGVELIARYDNGKESETVLLGPLLHRPLAVVQNGATQEVRFPVPDLQGNVIALVDRTGTAIEHYRYDAYGQRAVFNQTGGLSCQEAAGSFCAAQTAYGHSAVRRDPFSGLYQYPARDYSTGLRMFLTPDPLGAIDSHNPFVFAAGDPINFIDPLGLYTSPVAIGWQKRGANRYTFTSPRGTASFSGEPPPGLPIAPGPIQPPRGTAPTPQPAVAPPRDYMMSPAEIQQQADDYWNGFQERANARKAQAEAPTETNAPAPATPPQSDRLPASIYNRGEVMGQLEVASDAADALIKEPIREAATIARDTAVGGVLIKGGAAVGGAALRAIGVGGAGARTFEILDGVRRAKAAAMAGKTSIRPDVEVGGKVVETLEVPLDFLRSPFKRAIDVTSSPRQFQRWERVMEGTQRGDSLPPIKIQPGSRGPSIFDILFE